jgi:hypothetical protein
MLRVENLPYLDTINDGLQQIMRLNLEAMFFRLFVDLDVICFRTPQS